MVDEYCTYTVRDLYALTFVVPGCSLHDLCIEENVVVSIGARGRIAHVVSRVDNTNVIE